MSLAFVLFASLWLRVSAAPCDGIDLSADGFEPFGVLVGDELQVAGDDIFFTPTLLHDLVIFGSNRSTIFVSNNGIVTFDEPFIAFTPTGLFSVPQSAIAVFWADVDTSTRNSSLCENQLLIRVSAEAAELADAERRFARRGLRLDDGDEPRQLIVATWVNVTGFRLSPLLRNTFQMSLLCSPQRTLVRFAYAQLDWTTGTASQGIPAAVGVTQNNLNFFEIPESRTSAIAAALLNLASNDIVFDASESSLACCTLGGFPTFDLLDDELVQLGVELVVDNATSIPAPELAVLFPCPSNASDASGRVFVTPTLTALASGRCGQERFVQAWRYESACGGVVQQQRFIDVALPLEAMTQCEAPFCGDDVCTGDETCGSCALDCGNCCGNSVCDEAQGESCDVCADDCRAALCCDVELAPVDAQSVDGCRMPSAINFDATARRQSVSDACQYDPQRAGGQLVLDDVPDEPLPLPLCSGGVVLQRTLVPTALTEESWRGVVVNSIALGLSGRGRGGVRVEITPPNSASAILVTNGEALSSCDRWSVRFVDSSDERWQARLFAANDTAVDACLPTTTCQLCELDVFGDLQRGVYEAEGTLASDAPPLAEIDVNDGTRAQWTVSLCAVATDGASPTYERSQVVVDEFTALSTITVVVAPTAVLCVDGQCAFAGGAPAGLQAGGVLLVEDDENASVFGVISVQTDPFGNGTAVAEVIEVALTHAYRSLSIKSRFRDANNASTMAETRKRASARRGQSYVPRNYKAAAPIAAEPISALAPFAVGIEVKIESERLEVYAQDASIDLRPGSSDLFEWLDPTEIYRRLQFRFGFGVAVHLAIDIDITGSFEFPTFSRKIEFDPAKSLGSLRARMIGKALGKLAKHLTLIKMEVEFELSLSGTATVARVAYPFKYEDEVSLSFDGSRVPALLMGTAVTGDSGSTVSDADQVSAEFAPCERTSVDLSVPLTFKVVMGKFFFATAALTTESTISNEPVRFADQCEGGCMGASNIAVIEVQTRLTYAFSGGVDLLDFFSGLLGDVAKLGKVALDELPAFARDAVGVIGDLFAGVAKSARRVLPVVEFKAEVDIGLGVTASTAFGYNPESGLEAKFAILSPSFDLADSGRQQLACRRDVCDGTPALPPCNGTSLPLTPTPPPPPPPFSGRALGTTKGDPHLVSFDGCEVPFMAVGEYVLVDVATPTTEFHVHARFQSLTTSARGTTWVTAFAVRGGALGDTIHAARSAARPSEFELLLNCQAAHLASGCTLAFNGGNVTRRGQSLVFVFASEATLTATFRGGVWGLVTGVPSAFRSLTSGLLGDFDGDAENEVGVVDQTGQPVAACSGLNARESFQALSLYRLTNDDASLLCHAAGESADSFFDASYEPQLETVFSSEAAETRARQLCRFAASEAAFGACLFDAAAATNSSDVAAVVQDLLAVVIDPLSRDAIEFVTLPDSPLVVEFCASDDVLALQVEAVASSGRAVTFSVSSSVSELAAFTAANNVFVLLDAALDGREATLTVRASDTADIFVDAEIAITFALSRTQCLAVSLPANVTVPQQLLAAALNVTAEPLVSGSGLGNLQFRVAIVREFLVPLRDVAILLRFSGVPVVIRSGATDTGRLTGSVWSFDQSAAALTTELLVLADVAPLQRNATLVIEASTVRAFVATTPLLIDSDSASVAVTEAPARAPQLRLQAVGGRQRDVKVRARLINTSAFVVKNAMVRLDNGVRSAATVEARAGSRLLKINKSVVWATEQLNAGASSLLDITWKDLSSSSSSSSSSGRGSVRLSLSTADLVLCDVNYCGFPLDATGSSFELIIAADD